VGLVWTSFKTTIRENEFLSDYGIRRHLNTIKKTLCVWDRPSYHSIWTKESRSACLEVILTGVALSGCLLYDYPIIA
jgi:hypothetical protein